MEVTKKEEESPDDKVVAEELELVDSPLETPDEEDSKADEDSALEDTSSLDSLVEEDVVTLEEEVKLVSPWIELSDESTGECSEEELIKEELEEEEIELSMLSWLFVSLDEEMLEEAKIEEDSLSEETKEESGEGSSLEVEELSVALVEETKGGVMEQAIIDKAKGKRVKFRMIFFFIVLTSAYHYRGST